MSWVSTATAVTHSHAEPFEEFTVYGVTSFYPYDMSIAGVRSSSLRNKGNIDLN